MNSAKSWKNLIGTDPVVAMLSHSTYGSAKNDDQAKVAQAAAIARELAPELALDGRAAWADAAMVPSVGASKAPDSKGGRACKLSDLPRPGRGNIGYKLVQRLAQCRGVRPGHAGHCCPG